jgi:antitoxin HigA-1
MTATIAHTQDTDIHSPSYDPARLFDTVRQRLQLHSDKALAKALQIAPPLLARLRERVLPVSGSLLLRIQDVSGIAVAELQRVLGDRRRRMRLALAARKASNGAACAPIAAMPAATR